MAEAFAAAYGSDVMIAASAGVAPANGVHPTTMRVMEEKNLDLKDHFPKGLRHLGRSQFDIVVNMSGTFLPNAPGERVIDWDVEDPVVMEWEDHCKIRDEIERRVMELILELRRPDGPRFRGQGSGRV
jgi:protein-tyrosine-phosphatase